MEHPAIRGLSGWRPLARGGTTLVWEAHQDLLSRPVAVKVYRQGLAAGVYETFAREADIAGRLSDHPGVVTVYDAGLLPDARPYLIMELCSGGSLSQWLDPANLHAEEEIRRVGMRVADALAGLHARGVLHRDVKPANILIDGFGRPRLADFGLATVVGAESVATDALRITPAYAPPEAFVTPTATETGDVFSLAATVYALLSGQPPHRSAVASDQPSLVEIAAAPISALPGVNWHLMDAVMAALNVDSAARPSAAEFRDRLSGVQGHRTRRGRPTSTLARDARVAEHRVRATPGVSGATRPGTDVPREGGRRRAGLVAAAASLVLLAASGTAWLVAEPASSGAPTAALQNTAPSPVPSAVGSSGIATAAPDAPVSAPPVRDAPVSAPPVRDAPVSAPPVRDAPVSAPPVRDAVGSAPIVGAIQVEDPTATAEPFETTRIRGTYAGGGQRFLQVQLWADGTWRAFPVPAKTDPSGRFTAYIELGRPNSYRLRVRDPQSAVTSEPFTLVIEDAAGA